MPTELRIEYRHGERSCPVLDDAARITEGYLPYTTDESRSDGSVPQRIYFPESLDDLAAAVTDIAARSEELTISAGRTGIVGGAVSAAPNLISLERLRALVSVHREDSGQGWVASVAAGTTLEELSQILSEGSYEHSEAPPEELFYPVDPTEMTATVGGTIATNASGARTLKYGPTRAWVRTVTVVTADGGVLRLDRSVKLSADRLIRYVAPNGEPRELAVEPIPRPNTKHTAGYYLQEDMDLVDLFVGSEGTLGIVASADLLLAPRAPEMLCLFVFLPHDNPGPLVRELKVLEPAAIEYMDANSLDLLRSAKDQQLDGGAVPALPCNARAALYLELEASDESEIEELYERLEPILEQHSASVDDTWAGFTDQDLAAMKKFRHLLPERVNAIIAERKREVPEITKIGTDMAVPDDAFDDMLSLYRDELTAAGLDYCIFGHIGNGHVHVNILPRSKAERAEGYALYKAFAERAVDVGGSVSAEHGIGRLKKPFLRIQHSDEEITRMTAVKQFLDPDGALNPGVLF